MKGLKKRRVISSEDGEGRKDSRNRMTAVAMLSCVFLASLLVVGWNLEWFYGVVYDAEGYLQSTVKQMRGTVSNPNDGTVSMWNIYPAGVEQMKVWTEEKPGETIYLKGFSGGSYSSGEWQPADEDIIFQQMNENSLHWEQWDRMISGMYHSMFFVMNSSMMQGGGLPAHELWIQQREDVERQSYTPYFSREYPHGRALEEERERENEYGYQYYETGEMKFDWDNVVQGYELTREWYREILEAYSREIEEPYTEVPEESLPLLAQFCMENPAESLEQATALILSVLQDNAVYTRTPGFFPMNEDPVEYFLFEGHEGYCQHFASAAVLMYRLYGFPARYAAGYAVSPSLFTQQEDGTWMASVTDEHAHAWPEVFLEDYGWVPVEVTFSGETDVPAYPGMDSALLEGFWAEQTENPIILQNPENRENTPGNFSDAAQDFAFSINLPDRWVIMENPIYLLLFAIAAFLAYRLFQLWSIEFMDVRRLFSKMKKAAQSAGLLKNFDGSEEELALYFARMIPGFTDEQARLLLFIVQEASFGSTPAEQSRETEVRQMYRQIVRSIYRELPIRKKVIFKYIRTFL